MNCCLSCCLPLLMSTIIGKTCHVHVCSRVSHKHIHTCKSEVDGKWLGFADSFRRISSDCFLVFKPDLVFDVLISQ